MNQNDRPTVPGALDTGLPINRADFRALVVDYLNRMESGTELSIDDYITMTRLWNTIEFARLGSEDSLFREYSAAFFPAFVERVSESLHALPTKGMALYSKEHDIYLGGKPHAQSQYRLEDS